MSWSVYVTVKFWAVNDVLLYPATMLSVRAFGDFAPAFAYVTVYVISLSSINVPNSSLYVPVIAFGVMLIPVT